MATLLGNSGDREPSIEDAVGTVIGLFQRYGGRHYGEAVTQADHARQCGAWAMASGAEGALVAAAFLHDLGHLLVAEAHARCGTDRPDRAGNTQEHGERHHDLGADLLSRWFGDEVTEPVRLHVAAKRYLCAVDPIYPRGLSSASVRSLAVQGGPMTTQQQAAFRANRHWKAAVELRQWDDRAKDPGAPAPSLEFFAGILSDVLSTRGGDPVQPSASASSGKGQESR